MEVKEEVIQNEDEKKEIKIGLSATIVFAVLFMLTVGYMILFGLVKHFA